MQAAAITAASTVAGCRHGSAGTGSKRGPWRFETRAVTGAGRDRFRSVSEERRRRDMRCRPDGLKIQVEAMPDGSVAGNGNRAHLEDPRGNVSLRGPAAPFFLHLKMTNDFTNVSGPACSR